MDLALKNPGSNKRQRLENDNSEEEEDGITSPATSGQEVYIILDRAQLETVKTKKGDFQLMNCDDHVTIMKRIGKDPQMYRPDIVHQVRGRACNLVFGMNI